MESRILTLIGYIAAGEILVHILFYAISKFIGKANKDRIDRVSILKGLLERSFIAVSLYYNMTAALTLLGALKIATRIKDPEDRVSNDFFVIGNLVSVLFGMMYFLLIKNIVGIHE